MSRFVFAVLMLAGTVSVAGEPTASSGRLYRVTLRVVDVDSVGKYYSSAVKVIYCGWDRAEAIRVLYESRAYDGPPTKPWGSDRRTHFEYLDVLGKDDGELGRRAKSPPS